jgi:hypothetical protein
MPVVLAVGELDHNDQSICQDNVYVEFNWKV